MPADLAQRLLDARVSTLSPEERSRRHGELRWLAFARTWAAADRAGPMSVLERARFILRRLYPELEGPRLESIIEELAVRERAGTWHGFCQQPPRSHDD